MDNIFEMLDQIAEAKLTAYKIAVAIALDEDRKSVV
jgi:hypothetical protein